MKKKFLLYADKELSANEAALVEKICITTSPFTK
jgi:hypothetical protein